VAAVPSRLAKAYARQFGVAIAAAPIPLARSPIRAIAPKAAMADSGVAWLFGVLETVTRGGRKAHLSMRRTR